MFYNTDKMVMKKIECVNILGTKITVLDYPTAVRLIDDQVKRKSSFVCASDTHLLMESYNDKKLQKGINKSLMTTTDGMPLVWMASNILKKKVNRVYGPDLMLKVCRLAQNRKLKIFLLGGAPGQGQVLAKRLMGLFPGLNIVGIEEASARPISEKDNSTIVYTIKKLKPDIIFVGVGCPHQEKWMIRNYGKFNRGSYSLWNIKCDLSVGLQIN